MPGVVVHTYNPSTWEMDGWKWENQKIIVNMKPASSLKTNSNNNSKRESRGCADGSVVKSAGGLSLKTHLGI